MQTQIQIMYSRHTWERPHRDNFNSHWWLIWFSRETRAIPPPPPSIHETLEWFREQYDEGSIYHKRVILEHLITVPDGNFFNPTSVRGCERSSGSTQRNLSSLRCLRRHFNHKDDVETVDRRDTTEDDAMNLLISTVMAMRLAEPMLYQPWCSGYCRWLNILFIQQKHLEERL